MQDSDDSDDDEEFNNRHKRADDNNKGGIQVTTSVGNTKSLSLRKPRTKSVRASAEIFAYNNGKINAANNNSEINRNSIEEGGEVARTPNPLHQYQDNHSL